MHEEHCFSRFHKFYVYLVLYTIKKMFFVQCYFLFYFIFSKKKARNIGLMDFLIQSAQSVKVFLGEPFKHEMSQIVEKVHSFLDPPP